MPQYEYVGINATGKSVKGSVITDSLNAAKSQLRRDGVYPSSIREMSLITKDEDKGGLGLKNFFKSVSAEDLALMTRQLSTLIGAHVPLVEALGALTDQIENPKLRGAIAQVKSDVNEGAPFHRSLARYSDVFGELFVNMVEAGEASGTLEIVLGRLADFLEYQDRLRKRVKSAMTYPILMIVVGFAAMLIIFTKVIPQIASVFTENKQSLPVLTQITLAISDFLVGWWWAVILLMAGTVVGIRKYVNSPGGSRWWDAKKLTLPIFGDLVRMIAVSRFTKTLSTMLRSGIPLLTSLGVVKNVVGNATIKNAIDQATTDLTEGANISDPLKRSGQFPPLVTHMISVGERTGDLEEMLDKVSEHYEYQVDSKVQSLTSLLEPLMIGVLAVMVLIIVLSVVLPMLEINNAAL